MGEPWPPGGASALQRPAATTTADAGSPPQAALQLYAQVLGAASLESAAHAFVAALAAQCGFDRVSLGIVEAGRTRLLASSHLDLRQQAAELPQSLRGAMDEANDQGVVLAWPPIAGDAGDWIRVEQRALQREVGGTVVTVPLGVGGEPFGALCVERHAGAAPDAADIEQIGQLSTLAVPALRWMQFGAQPWHRRTRRDLMQALAALRQPQQSAKRRLIAAAALALAFVALAPLEHEVSGRARIEGAQQRVLAAPTDGFVKTAHVRPGDRVKAGAPLVDLLEQDLRLERERWSSQLAQHENAYAAALERADRGGAERPGLPARRDPAGSR